MDIRTVLEQIEVDKRTENLTAKLYRYMGLMQSIEHFSQKLSRMQIMNIAYESVNELLVVVQSSLFVREGDQLIIRAKKGVELDGWGLPLTESLRNIALMNKDIINKPKAVRALLGDHLYEAMCAQAIVLFVSDDEIEGLLVVGEKAAGSSFNDDDAIILESLMRLTNNALENQKRLTAMEHLNKQMDDKVFKLSAINQATHLLMSETNTEELYRLSIDAFAELTHSGRTGFFLNNPETGNLELKAYHNTQSPNEQLTLSLHSLEKSLMPENNKLFNMADPSEAEAFSQLFENGAELLEPIGARYVVLLEKKGSIPGFVTLGDKTNGESYTTEQFELIESLASSTYIAVANAGHIEELNRQKSDLHKRLDRLLSLSTLIKNINSCGNVETLLELTGRTLAASFGVKKGLVLLYDSDQDVFRISRKLSVGTVSDVLPTDGIWHNVMEGTVICEQGVDRVRSWLPKEVLPDITGVDGLLVEPIYYTDIHRVVLGAIVVLAFEDTDIRHPESLLTMEAISNHLSLVMTSLHAIERERRFQLPNHVERFKRELKRRIEHAIATNDSFDMVLVTDRRGYVFRENNLAERLEDHYDHIYPVAHNEVFVIPGDDQPTLMEDISRMLEEEEAIIRPIRFGVEYHDFQGFFDLFNSGNLLG